MRLLLILFFSITLLLFIIYLIGKPSNNIKINLIGLNYNSDEDIFLIKKTIENFYGFKCEIKNDKRIKYRGDTDRFLFKTKIISYDCGKIHKELGNFSFYIYNSFQDINIYLIESEIYNDGLNVNGVNFGNKIYITTDLSKRVIKRVVIHEISHNYGLGHCMSKKCIMDSETPTFNYWNDVVDKPIFCDDCKSKLPSLQKSKL
jgi:predicted Zn-dependent protease